MHIKNMINQPKEQKITPKATNLGQSFLFQTQKRPNNRPLVFHLDDSHLFSIQLLLKHELINLLTQTNDFTVYLRSKCITRVNRILMAS